MTLEGYPRVAPHRQWKLSSGLRVHLPTHIRMLLPLLAVLLIIPFTVSACTPDMMFDAELTKNVRLELADWHVSGLWVINSPVCWFKVYNYNNVPITDITIDYQTFDFDGKPLDKGSYTLLESGETAVVHENSPKNIVEQYIGIVSLESDKLSCKLKGVRGK